MGVEQGTSSGSSEADDAQRTAAASFMSYASPLVEEAVSQMAELGEKAEVDAEILHRLRVALRRLRALLWAYRPMLEPQHYESHQALFKQLADAAGSTRDWDIAIELIDRTQKNGATISGDLLNARAKALELSRIALACDSAGAALRNALADANAAQLAHDNSVSLQEFADTRMTAAQHVFRKRMRKARRAKHPDDASLHEMRKAAKKVRYLREFFGPPLSTIKLKESKRLKRIHERLGALNDVVASETLLDANRQLFSAPDSLRDAMRALRKERKRCMRSAAELL
ncbi:CHAD domain-containing protein [Paraburkholderia sp. D15]|uniref:CHAD domain-containing protein n=1 Tax=Paraburkholderia sp. D15 TaxID=2880218 RepID=UPI002479459E|nr:CHAD domain-containing protein [Paraburkholderia sp. D15]WGS53760.1 CHAD domain-containing protein [Paraburkholderia sp. D15]